jgi:hypothetical protein
VYAAAAEAIRAVRAARRVRAFKKFRLAAMVRYIASGQSDTPYGDAYLEAEFERLQRIKSLAITSMNVVPDGTMFVSDEDWLLLERTYDNAS